MAITHENNAFFNMFDVVHDFTNVPSNLATRLCHHINYQIYGSFTTINLVVKLNMPSHV